VLAAIDSATLATNRQGSTKSLHKPTHLRQPKNTLKALKKKQLRNLVFAAHVAVLNFYRTGLETVNNRNSVLRF
jgi:hypothetical protein